MRARLGGIWFVRGVFKYLDEDEDYYYVRVIHARLFGIGPGVMWYVLRFPTEIILGKPFLGFLPQGPLPLPGVGICREWDYVE
jgi:hypothetical protein